MSKSAHPPEQVLVIPANLGEAMCNYQEFHGVASISEQIILDNHSFRDREEAETNYAFKQVIPYVVVAYSAYGGKIPYYLLSQRTSHQQEKRLHNLYSLGQGGHITPKDMVGGIGSPLTACALREVQEEFHLRGGDIFEQCGLVNDNSTDVGKVHLGLVYAFKVDSLEFSVAEEGKHIASWKSGVELEEYYDRMENWSKILMRHVIRPDSCAGS